MKKRGLGLLAFAALLIWPGFAWSKNEALKGLQAVQPFFARLSPGATECGVTVEKLEAAIEEPIGVSGLKLSEAAEVYLYVNVTTLHLESQDFCVSSLSIDVYSRQYVELAATKLNVPATITLWESGVVFGGPTDSHLEQVLDALGVRTNEFVTAWVAAQQ